MILPLRYRRGIAVLASCASLLAQAPQPRPTAIPPYMMEPRTPQMQQQQPPSAAPPPPATTAKPAQTPAAQTPATTPPPTPKPTTPVPAPATPEPAGLGSLTLQNASLTEVIDLLARQ